MDIPLHPVRTLQALVWSGTVWRAAAFLHLSQPAVSKHVHLLEERVSLPLPARGKRPVPTSTAAGLSKALTAGEVDLAVVTLPMADRSLVATPFFREALVTAGLGLAICSGSALGRPGRGRARAILDLEPPLHRQLRVVRRKDKRVGAALSAVLAILEDLRDRAPPDRAFKGSREKQPLGNPPRWPPAGR